MATASITREEARKSASARDVAPQSSKHFVVWLCLWFALVEVFCATVRPLKFIDVPGIFLEDKDQLDTKLKALSACTKSPDVMILGSSLASAISQADMQPSTPDDPSPHRFATANNYFDSVLSRAINKSTTTFNLGVDASLINEDQILFDQAVRNNVIPRVVLIMVAPRDFIDNSRDPKAHVYKRVHEPQSLWQQVSWSNPLQKNFDAVVNAASSLYKQRSKYRQVAELTAVDKLHRAPNLFYAQQGEAYWRNFQPARLLLTPTGKVKQRTHLSKQEAAEKTAEMYKRCYFPLNRERFEFELQSLDSLLADIHAHGGDAVVINMPRSDTNDALLPPEFRKEYIERLGKLCNERNISFLDFRALAKFSEAEFSDGVHLDGGGARRFDQLLSQRLASDSRIKAKLVGLSPANDIGRPIGENRTNGRN